MSNALKFFGRVAGCATLFVTIVAAPLAVKAQPKPMEMPQIRSSDVCPQHLASMAANPGVLVGCWCPSNETEGSVWGSGPYTGDSALCAAAKHSGLLSDDGGAIWARVLPGLSSYVGTEANGISTSDYGPYQSSFELSGGEAAASDGAVRACPPDMTGRSGMLICACAPGQGGGATVWGTDIYTEDSNVCAAALHAGVVSSDGGTITALPVAGLPSYSGSERNGISTRDYGPWGKSFLFPN